MSDRLAPRSSWSTIVVLLIYFGIAVGVTWPLAANLTTHFPGGSQDTFVHYWNGWWVKQALIAGQSPYHTPYLYHPTGMSLVYHNFAWISIVTWLVLEPLAGGFGAYNLSILINLALCGLGAFLLARELTNDRRAAFLAGLIYQCWPFRLSQLDHPNLISTQWIPIFLLFLIRTVRQGKRRDALLTGVFLALTAYTRWQQLVPAAILGGIYLVCALPGQLASWRRWLPALLLIGGLTTVALTPPATLLVEQQRSAPADVLVEGDEDLYQTDLMAYVTPSKNHSVLKSFTRPAHERYYADRYENRRFAAYVGATALGLALLGLWKIRRVGLPWVIMALVLILLALGPILRINGQTYPDVPMPYSLASRLYVVRLMRVPDRFNMFLASPVAVLSAYGATNVLSIVQRRSRRRGQWATLAASCLLGGAILFEYLAVPLPLRYPQESRFYVQLFAETGDFAVLNLPISALESKRYMFAQVTHQHPILQGKTPRFPQGTFDYLNSHPWLGALRQSSTMPPAHTDVSRQLATLARDYVRYVILHKESSHPLRLSHWQRYFLTNPRFEDELVAVYPTIPLAGRDFALTDELAPGIGPVRVNVSADCLNPGQPLRVEVGWGTTAPPGRNLDVKLALVTGGGAVHQEQVFPLSPSWPTGEWPANAVAWGYYKLSIAPSVPSGEYTITTALVDPATGVIQGQAVPVGRVAVSESACPYPIPADVTRMDAFFGDDLHLLGYQLHRDGDQLTVTLHWRAERLIETDHIIFVHVFDPTSGLRVAQDDSMPLRWGYPTTYWDAGEIVSDDIPLSLENAPAGVYSVAVGIYEMETMKRSPVMDSSGQFLPDSQIILPGGTIEVESHE